MVRKIQYRLESEGFAELERQFVSLGDAGQKALDNLKAKMPEFADAAERAKQRAEAARKSLEEAARVDFRNLQASIDPAAAAMQRLSDGTERVNNALKLGVVSQGEANSVLTRLKTHYEDAGRAGAGFTNMLGLARTAMGAFGLSITAAGLYRIGRELLQSSDEGRQAMSRLGEATDNFKQSIAPQAAGAARMLAKDLDHLTASINDAKDAWNGNAKGGLIGAWQATMRERPSQRFPAGFEPPDVAITQYQGPYSVPDEFFLKLAQAKQGQIDDAAAAAQKRAEETAAMLKDIRDREQQSLDIVNDSFAKQIEASRKRDDELRSAGEKAAAERIAIYNREMDAQSDAAEKAKDARIRAAEESARAEQRALSQFGNDVMRFIGALGIGGGNSSAIGSGIALILSTLGQSGAFGGGGSSNLGSLFGGASSIAAGETGGIPDRVQITPKVFGSNMGMFGKAMPYLSGGMQGYQIGSITSQLFGGNAQNSSIGGALGGMAGMAFGPIGSLVGAGLGSLIGGLFGPTTPSNYTAAAYFGGGFDVTRMAGDKPNQNTNALAGSSAAQIEQTVAGLKGYGIGFSRGLDFLAIGEQRNSYFRLAGDTANRTIGSVGNANDLSFEVMRALMGNATGASGAMTTALGGAKNIADFTARADFVARIYDVAVKGTPALSSFASEMESLTKSFAEASAKAREYGLDVDALQTGYSRTFNDSIAMQIMQIQDPNGYAREMLRRDATARHDASVAGGAGFDVDLADRLSGLLSSQLESQIAEAARQAAANDNAPRNDFLRNVYGPVSAGLPALTGFENEMVALIEAFADGASRAREFGLSVAQLGAGLANSFNENSRLQLLSIDNPMAYSAEMWRRDAQARLDAGAMIGGDLGQVNALNGALWRQMNAPAISSLQQFQNSLGFGPLSAASQSDQYFSALSAYNTAKSAALGGGDPQTYLSAASSFFPLARSFLGTSEAYGNLTREASGISAQLLERMSSPPDLVPSINGVAVQVAMSGDQIVAAINDLKKQFADSQATMTSNILSMLSVRLAA